MALTPTITLDETRYITSIYTLQHVVYNCELFFYVVSVVFQSEGIYFVCIHYINLCRCQHEIRFLYNCKLCEIFIRNDQCKEMSDIVL